MPPLSIHLVATYRLQFNASFTLDDARALVPYLRRLGVSHVYASPLLAARPGSTHGYDVVDPRRVNPELGGEPALRALSATLAEHGMGLVLDIVPNHMGTGDTNPFWDDVLARGRASPYAPWFDIDWNAPPARGRVLLPVLGDELDAVIARDELRLTFADGAFRVAYYENSFPLDPATAHRLLGVAGHPLFAAADARDVRDPSAHGARDQALADLTTGDIGRRRLRGLLDAQHYSLTYWRRAAQELDYRRFFDVNDLAALRADAPGVFEQTHGAVLDWVQEGIVDALRIDHVDGLADPLGYLLRLRAELERRRPDARVPIFVEKILTGDERLRLEWPVEGTTGYEFANAVEAMLIDADGAAALERGYHRVAGRGAARGFHHAARRGKSHVLRTALAADVHRLGRELRRAAPSFEIDRGLTSAQLALAFEELIVGLPVYRTYVDARPEDDVRGPDAAPAGSAPGPLRVRGSDRRYIERAIEEALARRVATPDAIRAVARVLLGRSTNTPPGVAPHSPADAWPFVARFQQTSGPAAAKGVEDTALYRYVPLVSLNEVGGEAGAVAADAPARLHAANAERAERWPAQLLAVSTHDTKRSADVRARIDVLSEIPERWLALVDRWRRQHAPLRTRVGTRRFPDANAEYLFYQTALGVWPAGDGGPVAPEALASLAERVEAYMLKAVREAKVHTTWTDPRPGYEAALGGFVRALVAEPAGASFRDDLAALVAEVDPAGRANALARTLVHLTAPGTPDVYQGDELWNLALVDPDNRRPVDYAARARLLDALAAGGGHAAAGAPTESGALKLHVVHAALAARRADPALFAGGAYLPLAATGPAAHHLFAVARLHEGRAALTIVPRLTLRLAAGGAAAGVGPDTRVALPPELAGFAGRDALTGRPFQAADGALAAEGGVLAPLPLLLLVGTVG